MDETSMDVDIVEQVEEEFKEIAWYRSGNFEINYRSGGPKLCRSGSEFNLGPITFSNGSSDAKLKGISSERAVSDGENDYYLKVLDNDYRADAEIIKEKLEGYGIDIGIL
jgi:hypothetical protein